MTEKNTQRAISVLRWVAGASLRSMYHVSDFMYVLLYHVLKYRRKVVWRNLTGAFPEKSEAELREIEKGFYHQLCDTAVESFKLLNISNQELIERIDIQGCELVERVAAEGRSVILLLGHCGCWEWGQEISVRYKAPKRGGEIYKHIPNHFVEALMTAMREHWDTTLIEMRSAARTVLKWHKEGEPFLIGFISDQRAYSPVKRWTTFMNQPTDFVSGGEELAQRIGAEILYLDIEKTARGHYRMTFKEMHPKDLTIEAPYTRLFYEMLEQTIRRQPHIWLWSHNRWKNKNEFINQNKS